MKIIKEFREQKKINTDTNFICFEGYVEYIQCSFTIIEEDINNHLLGLFNSGNYHCYIFMG